MREWRVEDKSSYTSSKGLLLNCWLCGVKLSLPLATCHPKPSLLLP